MEKKDRSMLAITVVCSIGLFVLISLELVHLDNRVERLEARALATEKILVLAIEKILEDRERN